MFKLNLVNVKSALIYGVLWGLLAMFVEIKQIGDIFKLDWYVLANVSIMAFLAVVIVLLKNLLTTDSGDFLGVIKVSPPVK